MTQHIVNHIGCAGRRAFGLGICPDDRLPAGMQLLPGTDDPTSDNYGNYQYADSSVMVWIPASWMKIGTGLNGLSVNQVYVRPWDAYDSVAAASVDGFSAHRALHDGGLRDGFFLDKYLCSNNDGIASSINGGAPLSTYAKHNPIGALHGTPANAYHGVIAAAKTRGPDVFAATQFQRAYVALLALAHAQAATSDEACAWFDPEGRTSFPKGCNDGDLGDVHDSDVIYEPDGYSNCGLTGSATPFAKTTHNGQASGVADLNGLLWEVSPGLTAATDTGRHFVLAPSARMKDMTGGDGEGAHDLWGTEAQLLRAGYEPMERRVAPVLSEATSGRGWVDTGLGIPQRNTSCWVKPFAGDPDVDAEELSGPRDLCPLAGGGWDNGSNAGVWMLHLAGVRGASGSGVGFRAALYL